MTEATVWKIFSKYIRLRDATLVGNMLIGRCCTSNRPIVVYDGNRYNPKAHAGHFISRYYKATLFDEKNVHLQSMMDNTHRHGAQFEYGQWIDKKYGPGTADQILMKSKMLCKRTSHDFKYLYDHYKKKVKDLEEQYRKKGLTI